MYKEFLNLGEHPKILYVIFKITKLFFIKIKIYFIINKKKFNCEISIDTILSTFIYDSTLMSSRHNKNKGKLC